MADKLPRFEIRPLGDDDGGGYLIEFPDYPCCMADGETPEEAIAEGRDALTSYLATLRDLDRPVPPPLVARLLAEGTRAPDLTRARSRQGRSRSAKVSRRLAVRPASRSAIRSRTSS